MLKRRKESDTYLAADKRHHWSTQIMMKVDKRVAFSQHCGLHQLSWLKATHFIHFHHDVCTPAMSSVSSQVGVALSPSF